MNILSDAEYRRLTQTEKVTYWRQRYEERTEQHDHLRIENDKLVLILKKIREAMEPLR